MEALESGVDLINDHYGSPHTQPRTERRNSAQIPEVILAGLWLAFRFFFFPGYFQLHDGNEEIRPESRLNKRSNSLTFYNLPALSVGRCGTSNEIRKLFTSRWDILREVWRSLSRLSTYTWVSIHFALCFQVFWSSGTLWKWNNQRQRQKRSWNWTTKDFLVFHFQVHSKNYRLHFPGCYKTHPAPPEQ